MIGFATVVGSQETYDAIAGPALARVAEPDSWMAQFTDATSICSAYNQIVEAASDLEGIEALVLLHEDTEIRDPLFCAAVRRALRETDVAVAGVIGGRRFATMRWWEGQVSGRVREPRGEFNGGFTDTDVDGVDGLLMVLSPWAMAHLRFDEERFTAFHGYDLDYCMQARAAGRRVVVVPTDVVHHSLSGFGDQDAFDTAEHAWIEKWVSEHTASCPVCGEAVRGGLLGNPTVAVCGGCGAGVSTPSPPPIVPVRACDPAELQHEAAVRADWLRPLLEGARGVLDIGRDAGGLARALGMGATVSSLAPTGGTRDVTPLLAEVADGELDATVAFVAFERADDPRLLADEIRRVLLPGGTLIVEVPNIGSQTGTANPTAWGIDRVDRDVTHFTRDALRHVLEAAGFSVTADDVVPFAPYGTGLYGPHFAVHARGDDIIRMSATAPGR